MPTHLHIDVKHTASLELATPIEDIIGRQRCLIIGWLYLSQRTGKYSLSS